MDGGSLLKPNLHHEVKRATSKRERTSSYIYSFLWMILFTAIAFLLVGYQWFNSWLTILIIIILAFAQVLFQLFTFMHLNQKGSTVFIIFFGLGAFIAVVSAVGIVLMP